MNKQDSLNQEDVYLKSSPCFRMMLECAKVLEKSSLQVGAPTISAPCGEETKGAITIMACHLDCWIYFIILTRTPAIVRKSDENESFQPNQISPSFFIMITLLLFNRPMRVKDTPAIREMFQHYSLVRSLSTNARQGHIEEHSNSKTSVTLIQTKSNLMDYCP